MKTLALLTLLLAGDAPARIDARPAIPPRDRHPFGAIERRPLWERPRTDPLTLQQRAEDALDRGTGRIEDEASFELRLLERAGAGAGGVGIGVDPFDLRLRREARPRAEYERFQLERDRQERLEQRRRRLERALQRGRRLEREAETLSEVRRRFQEEANRPNQALGAVVDRQALEAIEREYRLSIAAAVRQHGAAVGAIAADETLSPAERAARRLAADQALEQSRAAAARRWEQRREEVLGSK